jgi:predicted alpha/beta superfamily hydrolase
MKIKENFRIFCFIAGLIISANIASAQVITRDSVFSGILNEERKIRVCVPVEYGHGTRERYDVIYITDGETNFDDFSFIYRFARREKLLPPLILVSLPNSQNGGNLRERDFVPGVNGADKFIAFLKEELIPYISNKYPVSGENSLFGHSLGGLFTMYVLLKEPGLFTNYFCSDPAFPWNNGYIIRMAEKAIGNTSGLNKTLWINGVGETYRNVGIGRMDSLLNQLAPATLRWKVAIYPGETHMSVRLKGVYDGLKYTFEGFNSGKMVEFHPMNGSLLQEKPVRIFLNGSFPDVYYTTDGSEPDTSSEKAPQMIQLTGPAQLTVKWLGENKKYVTSLKGNFELSSTLSSLGYIRDVKPGGLLYLIYEGKWERLPDFKKLKVVESGIADSLFDLNKLPYKNGFACVFEGYLKIDTDGYYLFALSSSDGSKFYINGTDIIDNDGLHGSDYYKSYVVPLQTGFYPVRFEFFHNSNEPHLNVIYLPPDMNETQDLSFKKMYYK